MELSEVRVNIDRVDNEIKKLFEERMHLSDEVARVKAEKSDSIYKPEREIEIIDRLTEGVDPSIKMEYTALIKRIMEVSRKYQYGRTLELKNCLDIKYSTELPDIKTAAVLKDEYYLLAEDKNIKLKDYNSTIDMAKAVLSGEVDAGVGVLEDIGFSVADGLHRILCENELYINACRVIQDELSSRVAKKKVVEFTKELVVRPDDNRLKIMFVCENKSGSLASVLSMISDYGINLTEIHSTPDENPDWNYVFIAELRCSFNDKTTKALVFQLENETQYFKVLGSYKIN